MRARRVPTGVQLPLVPSAATEGTQEDMTKRHLQFHWPFSWKAMAPVPAELQGDDAVLQLEQ